jgi:hypothetical protein
VSKKKQQEAEKAALEGVELLRKLGHKSAQALYAGNHNGNLRAGIWLDLEDWDLSTIRSVVESEGVK